MTFACRTGKVEEGVGIIVELCDKVMRSLAMLVADVSSKTPGGGDDGYAGRLRAEVERRLSGVRMGGEGSVEETVSSALSDLSVFVALASMGMRLKKGGEESEGIARIHSAGRRTPGAGPVLSGLLSDGEGVVFQVGMEFDGVSDGVRATLCELDIGGLVGEVVLPDRAFERCSFLRNVVWPTGLSRVGARAFAECRVLPFADLSATRVTGLGDGAFHSCRQMTGILLPGTFGALGEECLHSAGVRSLDLRGTKCTSIAKRALCYCEAFRGLLLPLCVRRLEYGCCAISGLERVDLSLTGVTTIEGGAFRGCWRLREVILPRTLEEVGDEWVCETSVQMLDFSGTRVKRMSWSALRGSRSARLGVVLSRCLEHLERRAYEDGLWGLDVCVDHLRTGGEWMMHVSHGLTLRGAGWWAKCMACAETLLLSRCVAGAAYRAARPLMPAA
jgi:hypothetical protein